MQLGTLFAPFALQEEGGPVSAKVYLSSADSEVQTTTNPEPATLMLMGGGIAGMFLRRRKKRS